MKYYINYSYDGREIETIDFADNYKTAKYLLNEYQISGGCSYWISKRATKDYYLNNK